jgi:hypothetical protein
MNDELNRKQRDLISENDNLNRSCQDMERDNRKLQMEIDHLTMQLKVGHNPLPSSHLPAPPPPPAIFKTQEHSPIGGLF